MLLVAFLNLSDVALSLLLYNVLIDLIMLPIHLN